MLTHPGLVVSKLRCAVFARGLFTPTHISNPSLKLLRPFHPSMLDVDVIDQPGAMQGRARDLSDEGFPRWHASHALRLLAPALARR